MPVQAIRINTIFDTEQVGATLYVKRLVVGVGFVLSVGAVVRQVGVRMWASLLEALDGCSEVYLALEKLFGLDLVDDGSGIAVGGHSLVAELDHIGVRTLLGHVHRVCLAAVRQCLLGPLLLLVEVRDVPVVRVLPHRIDGLAFLALVSRLG